MRDSLKWLPKLYGVADPFSHEAEPRVRARDAPQSTNATTARCPFGWSRACTAIRELLGVL